MVVYTLVFFLSCRMSTLAIESVKKTIEEAYLLIMKRDRAICMTSVLYKIRGHCRVTVSDYNKHTLAKTRVDKYYIEYCVAL